MPSLYTYNSGQWVERDIVKTEQSGTFDQAPGMHVYVNGQWEAIFAPEFQHKNAGTADDSLNAYGSGIY